MMNDRSHDRSCEEKTFDEVGVYVRMRGREVASEAHPAGTKCKCMAALLRSDSASAGESSS